MFASFMMTSKVRDEALNDGGRGTRGNRAVLSKSEEAVWPFWSRQAAAAAGGPRSRSPPAKSAEVNVTSNHSARMGTTASASAE
jgi:hypothetical protein